MTKKADIKKMVSRIKLEKKGPKPITIQVVKGFVNPMGREVDMRQDAINGGSHGAKEYFGGE